MLMAEGLEGLGIIVNYLVQEHLFETEYESGTCSLHPRIIGTGVKGASGESHSTMISSRFLMS